MSVKRVLPADVYDALELSALAFGGIGAGNYFDRHAAPVCAVGHLAFTVDAAEVSDVELDYRGWLGSRWAFEASDDAVEKINARRGQYREARVPFKLWCAELGVERGS